MPKPRTSEKPVYHIPQPAYRMVRHPSYEEDIVAEFGPLMYGRTSEERLRELDYERLGVGEVFESIISIYKGRVYEGRKDIAPDLANFEEGQSQVNVNRALLGEDSANDICRIIPEVAPYVRAYQSFDDFYRQMAWLDTNYAEMYSLPTGYTAADMKYTAQ